VRAQRKAARTTQAAARATSAQELLATWPWEETPLQETLQEETPLQETLQEETPLQETLRVKRRLVSVETRPPETALVETAWVAVTLGEPTSAAVRA
jgi:hypothetical protein